MTTDGSALDRLAGWLGRRPREVALGLFLVTLLIWGFRLRVPDIQGDDEALDAGVVWEMAHNDHWLLPFFNGEMVPEKPPLFFWLAAAIARLWGRVDETTVRLPSVVSGAIVVAMVFFAGRRMVGSGSAFLAALMVLSAPMMEARARTGRVDMLLVACATGAFFAAVFSLGVNAKRRHRNAFWLLAALTMLAKAGAGLGIVACGTLGLLLVSRQRPARLVSIEGVVAFLVLGCSWYAFAIWKMGERFVAVNLLQQNLNHLTGGLSGAPVNHNLAWLLQPTFDVIGGIAPWSVLGLIAVRGWRAAWPRSRFAAVWATAGLLLFSVAASRHPYYVAPLLPPLALFLGSVLWAERAAESPVSLLRVIPLSVGVATIVAAAAAIPLHMWAAAGWPGLSVSDRVNAMLLQDWWSDRPQTAALLCVSAASAAIFSLVAVVRRHAVYAFGVCLVVSLGIQAVTEVAVGSQTDARLSLKSFGAAVSRLDGPVYFYGPVIRQIVYHARRHIHHASVDQLSAQETFYLIATEAELPGLGAQLTHRPDTLTSGRGVVNNADVQRVFLLRIDNHRTP